MWDFSPSVRPSSSAVVVSKQLYRQTFPPLIGSSLYFGGGDADGLNKDCIIAHTVCMQLVAERRGPSDVAVRVLLILWLTVSLHIQNH